MHSPVRTITRWHMIMTAALVATLALWVVVAPPAAQAAPPANTWDLTTLQAHLESGSVPAYFLTVLGGPTAADQAPVAVPATITSIVPGATSSSSLILFAASGSAIDTIGGIADGMSGSPLYAGDSSDPHPSTDPLIGAVSYGDWFTKEGLGLATPIEDMIAIQTGGAAGASNAAARTTTTTLERPVALAATTVRRVTVAASHAAAKVAAASAGTAVFQPLNAVEIGGVSPRSKLFQRTAAKLEAAGHRVIAAPAAAPAYSPDWTTPLVPGASVGTLYADGDVWIGYAGTVTYVDGDTVLAYGHSLDDVGPTVGYLTNAWVSGVWDSLIEPYKLLAPAATVGAVTQDRPSGVEATIGSPPASTPVHASATFNGTTDTSVALVAQALVDGTLMSAYTMDELPTYAAQTPIYDVIGAGTLAGSARTTTTVVVNDGTRDYTVTVANTWDDPYDVTWMTTNDLDDIISTLTANADGTAPATIESVDFAADLSAQRNEARVVGVEVPGGLRIGANDVTVKLAQYGVQDLQTEHVNLTLPRGTELGRGIEVYGPGYWNDMYYLDTLMGTRSLAPGRTATSDDRMTVAGLVDDLEKQASNNDLVVDYSGSVTNSDGTSVTPGSTSSMPWVVNGDIYMRSSMMFVRASQRMVRRRAPVVIRGEIGRVTKPTKVSVFARRAHGGKRRLVATVPVSLVHGMGSFVYRASHVRSSTRFTFVWDGDDAYLGSTASTLVRVRAHK